MPVGVVVEQTRAEPDDPAEAEIALDWTVVAAAAACGLACSLLFGAIPAIRAASVDAALLLRRADTRTGSRPANAWRERLVTAQIALAIVVSDPPKVPALPVIRLTNQKSPAAST
jgi:predicted lysophospholipase L1 biosynthesis ABC-type transport system permease subunit